MISVARLHPAIISGVYAACALGAVLSPSNGFWPGAELLLSLCLVLIVPAWACDAARITIGRQTDPKLFLIFALAVAVAIGGILTLLLLPQGPTDFDGHPAFTTLMVVVGLSTLVLAWITAQVLVRAELKRGKDTSVFVTFLLIVYLVVGVWFLKPRLLDLERL